MQRSTALDRPVRAHRTVSTARLRASDLPCTAQHLIHPSHLSHM